MGKYKTKLAFEFESVGQIFPGFESDGLSLDVVNDVVGNTKSDGREGGVIRLDPSGVRILVRLGRCTEVGINMIVETCIC